MSWSDKLKFWKKEDESELPSFELPKPSHLSGILDPVEGARLGDDSFPKSQPSAPSFQPQSFQSFQQQPVSQPVRQDYAQPDRHELILARLDTIKAQLDNVLQRLDRLEKERRWP